MEKSTPPVLKTWSAPGLHRISLLRPEYGEWFVTASVEEGETQEGIFEKAARALEGTGASVVAQELFGFDGGGAALAEVFGPANWPVTCTLNASARGFPFQGVQVWAVKGGAPAPIELDGRVVGSVWEDPFARYCRLGDLRTQDPSAPPDEQARKVFDAMVKGLSAAAMDFSHVARTWFYFDEILAWYGDFNRVRDAFFSERKVFDGLVPASTGMGGPNPWGTALVGGLLAVAPRGDGVKLEAVPSPLQCPALEYGSAFSRALEVALPGVRKLFVSGTASIDTAGNTLRLDDADGQVDHTMAVVEAILESRGMAWTDVIRGIAYFKGEEDLAAFHRYAARRGLPEIPMVFMANDICREDLLFEIEVDAMKTGNT